MLRKAKARSFEALVEASGIALWAVSEVDARGFFVLWLRVAAGAFIMKTALRGCLTADFVKVEPDN